MPDPLNLFLSFASDVDEEATLAEEVVRKVNARARAPLGLLLESTTWREMPPLAPVPPKRIQDEINESVLNCQIFVLVVYKRYGSIEQGQSKSNLEREVEIALERLETQRKIMFLAYFRRLPENSDPGEQERRVIAFREHLQTKGIWFHEYSEPSDFADRLTHDLYHTLLKYRFSTQKHKAIQSLWQLGETDRPMYPQLAVIYPPVDRQYLKEEKPDRYWLDRLVPHIVFEDYKALQKIEKTLRLINFRSYRIFTTVDAPTEIDFMNRVWLCWPRNKQAFKALKRYSSGGTDSARFAFSPSQKGAEASILWRHSVNSKSFVRIRSPLSKYLELQRAAIPGGAWRADLGRIVAKDFAILSRFTDEREKQTIGPALLKDYFIGGIRGLGTWGAGWYIDRRYNHFRKYKENDNIQLLLEVIYRNGRIFDVRDVSDESDSYFRRENTVRHIQKVIKELK